MVEVRTTGVVERSAADVFAYAADYRRMTEWVFGITSVQPVGDSDYGPGAVFQGAVDLGPKTLSSTAKIVGWQQGRLIALDSLAGFDFTATLRLRPDGRDRTVLDFTLSYAHSGNIAARAFGKTIEPLLALAARMTTDRLCDACTKAAGPCADSHPVASRPAPPD
ncbi:SRPBCC family protein [Mycobacteroides salmoniphilum]|uniref:SRPBCC family protein n=1 Tax=Mycobacteroides salmoniphilum TaxID=404941 RepID=UPI0010659DD7|nr:SRPBCC family protein [Mycobacteroides salmoniphilum]TDZ99330.1 Polyketide cyclase / dehydrase and lipid transport [Mycobacteroides salmoniphilum]